ncbi:Aminoglycoside phosphotransferase [Penicillium cinerascens]|uniref:Aminoglycoside phosphotransferase n=1 Tax=Penicillium cinerascens TaxID=70096 RepID=A0A9W9NG75_9EURO|nr:Aminoglycoside phosphotransferase [Penicillium cinerascens]KAJ5218169.1 Aminoglycoside phosphotransferase [Penicillium cinerascens]
MTADFWPSAVKLSGSLSQRCVSSPLPPNPCEMDFDDLAKQQSDRIFQVWLQNLLGNSPEDLAGKLASRHYPGSTPATASRLSNGAFNVCYRVTFENGRRVVVRFVALGRVVARNEKVEDEVAIMQYVGQHTTIPVPIVLGSGKCAVGPYIVMSYIEGNPLSGYLRDSSQITVTLNLGISIPILRRAYFGMAEVLLELSKAGFPFIGAIRRTESDEWTVQKRPLTFNMNRLTQFSNIPLKVFERGRFNNAADYFEELARQQFYHLEFQCNNAITDEADCRKKYIARCLFRKLAREIPKEHCSGPFRLYCDDFRPDNVLVDASSLNITGVVDWEFSYAAPVEYTLAAPWWLLLESPEDWEPNLDQFLTRYMPKFRVFLEVLKHCETRKIQGGSLSESQRLSIAMEKSLETGLFWICLALRHSSMFDEIYWDFIDSRFYGPFTTTEDRLSLLSAEERLNIDAVVESKMRQASEGTLISHYSIDELVDL